MSRSLSSGWLWVVLCLVAAAPVCAQVPDAPRSPIGDSGPYGANEIVSFAPDTPFGVFLQYINPLFQRRYGKTLVDPTGSTAPLGYAPTGMPFPDALDLALQRAGLELRETDRYFLIQPVGQGAPVAAATTGAQTSGGDFPLATDREIRIDGLIFEVNLSRVREIGTDWSSVFGSQETSQGGGQVGNQGDRLRFFLRTRTFFDAISEIIVGPNQIDIAELSGIFRLLETNGVGRTISAPSVVVRSGQTGRIQSGSDIPFTTRDFSGNAINQFVSTGVIIEALPVLIAGEDEDGNDIEFVHLVISVERSNGRVGAAGVTIDKNEARTDILLLDGEQTVIGGLYSTEQSVEHRGIPILKDIPLLGYLFGVRSRINTERELIIVLKTTLVDRLSTRLRQPPPRNVIQKERLDRDARLNQTQSGLQDGIDTIIVEDQ